MSNVLVVAELADGKVRKSTHSAINFARQATSGGGSFSLLLLGPGAKGAAAEMAAFGAAKILVGDDAALADGVCERVAPTIAATAAAGGFDVVVMTASSFGKDVAPRVAAKLSAGYASDISAVKVDGGKLTYRRPVFAGNAYANCQLTTKVQVVSVRQSEFSAAEASGGASPVEDVAVTAPDASAGKLQYLGIDAAKSERPDLGEARVIVAGGRALKEKFADVLDPLANQLGAAIGASRAACDAGYAPAELQVGQTGRVVAPALYLAIGISGAIQHLAGMKGSKTIVAINKDPEAPIFQVADYGLVQDLFGAVPALVDELKAQS
ncbi:MAG: electron transfer flavoprotein subunit alpha/FixB family protein [Myxococcales bacterium]|nr:electron transfer flavoprotein subunit alpha/FixB family protein [Myxococcales bacterium]MBL0193566.1 electron transfer flavoprotein subunit alpha/FixB family protein [Myxococcales bacterium]HQY65243.1 electron transfer flavoprotein subunit alpha/FixB family protein [Polyangiaceae bacterium]